MALLAGSDRVALLAAAVKQAAQQEVFFARDETDSYRLQLEPIHPERRQLTRAEVMPALPVGSRWADAIGWESYVLFPIAGSPPLVIAGLEYVVEHATRGAYAGFAGAVIPADRARDVADAIAAGLDPGNDERVGSSYGVVISGATTLARHSRAAAWILRAGGAAYAEGSPRTVRTVLMTQDEVPRLRSVLSVGSISRRFLVGVVPPLRDHFTGASNMLLGLLTSNTFA